MHVMSLLSVKNAFLHALRFEEIAEQMKRLQRLIQLLICPASTQARCRKVPFLAFRLRGDSDSNAIKFPVLDLCTRTMKAAVDVIV